MKYSKKDIGKQVVFISELRRGSHVFVSLKRSKLADVTIDGDQVMLDGHGEEPSDRVFTSIADVLSYLKTTSELDNISYSLVEFSTLNLSDSRSVSLHLASELPADKYGHRRFGYTTFKYGEPIPDKYRWSNNLPDIRLWISDWCGTDYKLNHVSDWGMCPHCGSSDTYFEYDDTEEVRQSGTCSLAYKCSSCGCEYIDEYVTTQSRRIITNGIARSQEVYTDADMLNEDHELYVKIKKAKEGNDGCQYN